MVWYETTGLTTAKLLFLYEYESRAERVPLAAMRNCGKRQIKDEEICRLGWLAELNSVKIAL